MSTHLPSTFVMRRQPLDHANWVNSETLVVGLAGPAREALRKYFESARVVVAKKGRQNRLCFCCFFEAVRQTLAGHSALYEVNLLKILYEFIRI